MKPFFRKLGAFLTVFREWTVNLFTLALVIYLVVIAGILLGKLPREVDPEGKVLVISPKGVVLDQAVYSARLTYPFGLPAQDQVQSRDLVRVIRAAAADEKLAGVLLDFSKTSFAGVSTALSLAGELAALRQSGKPVIAYSDQLSTAAYMMAAQADELYLHPSGGLSVSGLGGYRDYMHELTEKLKITIHNYSQGDYKSATESLTRSDMSAADRRQREELYAPMWQAMKARMAAGRKVEPELLQTLVDAHPALLFDEADYDKMAWAQENGLIDGTRSFPEFRAMMIERFGEWEEDERETYPHISADAYLAQLPPEKDEAEQAVAVVFAQGVLQPGPQGPGVAGSDDIARLLRKAHEQEETRALVLRVNSPGGSIIASDTIRDELVAARRKGIPVVISMGDVAASGGLWVSTPANRIYAEPMTITGSIGVAVAFPTLENVFDYVGINFDGVTTSQYAGWNINLPVDEQMDAIFARWAGSAYQHFIDLVAEGRDRDPAYIRSIAGGRVWIAGAALERGLVDELGTLEDAIAGAARMAELEDYRVDYVVQEPPPALALLHKLGIEATSGFGSFAQRLASGLAALEDLSQPQATVMCTLCVIELN